MTTFYCINLDFRTDRWAQVQEETRRSGIAVKRVPAQDGTTAEFQARFDSGEFPQGFRNAREVAIWLSHIKAIKTALEDYRNGHNPAAKKDDFLFIIEDDILLVSDFQRRFTTALKTVPKKANMLYLGYLRYHFTTVKTQINPGSQLGDTKWLKMGPVYGLHAYAIRVSAAEAFLEFLAKCHQTVDDYITANYPDYVVATQPLAYQRLESASDITGWDFVANPFNRQVVNPLKLRYLWPTEWPKCADRNSKILHVLPGQKLYFASETPGVTGTPETPGVPGTPSTLGKLSVLGWTVKVWQHYDEIYDYKRYGKVVPFYLWVIYYYGGIVFPDEISHWLDKHYAETSPKIRNDVVSARRGEPEILKLIKAKVWAFDVGSEGGRWGKPLADKEVAPDFAE